MFLAVQATALAAYLESLIRAGGRREQGNPQSGVAVYTN